MHTEPAQPSPMPASSGTGIPPVVFSACTALTIALLTLTGCAGTSNSTPVVGTDRRAFIPESFQASPSPKADAEHAASPETARLNAATAAPSVAPPSLDRSSWPVTRLSVPNAQPIHQPRYTRSVFLHNSTRRARGEFPTIDSSLDIATAEANQAQTAEALVAPVATALDVALFPARTLVTRPWQRTITGTKPYQRRLTPRTEGPEQITPTDAPPASLPTPPEPLYEPEAASNVRPSGR